MDPNSKPSLSPWQSEDDHLEGKKKSERKSDGKEEERMNDRRRMIYKVKERKEEGKRERGIEEEKNKDRLKKHSN